MLLRERTGNSLSQCLLMAGETGTASLESKLETPIKNEVHIFFGPAIPVLGISASGTSLPIH